MLHNTPTNWLESNNPSLYRSQGDSIARMENGGMRPTLETLERVAGAVGQQLAVVVGPRLIENRSIENRSIAKLVRSGHAVVRNAS